MTNVSPVELPLVVGGISCTLEGCKSSQQSISNIHPTVVQNYIYSLWCLVHCSCVIVSCLSLKSLYFRLDSWNRGCKLRQLSRLRCVQFSPDQLLPWSLTRWTRLQQRDAPTVPTRAQRRDQICLLLQRSKYSNVFLRYFVTVSLSIYCFFRLDKVVC